MSVYCDYLYGQDCSLGCCDSYGYCPAFESYCYYYYKSPCQDGWVSSSCVPQWFWFTLGIVIGILLINLGIGLYCCQKKKRDIQRAILETPEQIKPQPGEPLNESADRKYVYMSYPIHLYNNVVGGIVNRERNQQPSTTAVLNHPQSLAV